MSGMKYIIINNDGCSDAILMGPTFAHKEVAQAMLGSGQRLKDGVKGAGFCTFKWNIDGGMHGCGGWEVAVFGRSASLGLESKEEDKVYVQMALDS